MSSVQGTDSTIAIFWGKTSSRERIYDLAKRAASIITHSDHKTTSVPSHEIRDQSSQANFIYNKNAHNFTGTHYQYLCEKKRGKSFESA